MCFYDFISASYSPKYSNILVVEDKHLILLYTNSKSRILLVFYWSRAYHVRVTKLDCLSRNSARGKQYVIDRRITKKSRAPSREDATFGHA
jgi:hypothetical protein